MRVAFLLSLHCLPPPKRVLSSRSDAGARRRITERDLDLEDASALTEALITVNKLKNLGFLDNAHKEHKKCAGRVGVDAA